MNELGYDRHGSKPLKVHEPAACDACVKPFHHGIHQVDVSYSLLLGRYLTFQADFTWYNACIIRVISLCNGPLFKRF